MPDNNNHGEQQYAPLRHTHNGIDSPKIDASLQDNYLPWSNYFYYFTFFDSIDGFALSGSAAVINDSGIVLQTTNSSVSRSVMQKLPQQQRILDFSKESRFRTGLVFNANMATASAYVTVSIAGENRYGFKVLDGIMYGLTGDSSTNTTNQVQLLSSIEADRKYELEALYAPNNSVKFFIDGELRNISRDSLPKGTAFTDWLEFSIYNGNAVSRAMTLSYFEFLHKR